MSSVHLTLEEALVKQRDHQQRQQTRSQIKPSHLAAAWRSSEESAEASSEVTTEELSL